jgi:hypothetical protein
VAAPEFRTPFIEDLYQPTGGYIFRNIVLQQISKTSSGSDGSGSKITVIADE